MKILNVLLSIFILLLAVASAVFSFFLFEKREQFVNGWSKLATTINQTAVELDRGSGTKVGGELTAESIGHQKYADLDGSLKKLVDQAKKVIAERDKLAVALVRVAGATEMAKVPTAAQLSDVKNGAVQANAVAAQAQAFRQNRDAVNNRMARSARTLGVTINPILLKNPAQAEVEFNKFDSRAGFIAGQINQFKRHIIDIGNTVGERNPNLADNTYAASLGKVLAAARKQHTELVNTTNRLRQKEREVANLGNTVKARDGQITGLNNTVGSKNAEINRLNKIITGSDERPPSPWLDHSPEARRAVVGRVIEVDNKFGYLVVDIGRNTQVEQKIGKKINRVVPGLPVDATMTVARNLDAGGEYVGRVKLVKIDDDCSIAEVQPGGKSVKVGDVVYFSAEELAAVEAKLKAAQKK